MAVLSGLEPKNVYRFFEELCAIPHGSFHTGAISNYLADFARARGLKYRQDATGNVVIFKPATAGYENAPTVMLQGHMDMVCEKEPDCPIDMETEGLSLFTEGDIVGARGTTLGGDDGIAVAMGLAILDAEDIPHGPLECLFTVDEEVGMTGARALDASDLHARYLLNLDSEADKIFTVSCAGSTRLIASFTGSRIPFTGEVLKLTVRGLQGGHSGEEIHKCRANANILMGRALCALLKQTELRLITVKGGSKDNAIPREAEALLAAADADTVIKAAAELTATLQAEFATADGGIEITAEKAASDICPFDAGATQRIACFLFCAPNAVQMMSADVEGLVQTSTNLGVVSTEGDCVKASFMVRSSVNSQRDETADRIELLAVTLGGTVQKPVTNSAWEYRAHSPLREVMVEAFREVYGEEPVISALHAGLECGVLAGKLPGLDCISIGPDLTDIHTPRERLHIASAMRIWRLVLETLKRLK